MKQLYRVTWGLLVLGLLVSGLTCRPAAPPDPPESEKLVTPVLVLPETNVGPSETTEEKPGQEPPPSGTLAPPIVTALPRPSDQGERLVTETLVPFAPGPQLFPQQTAPKVRLSNVERGDLSWLPGRIELPMLPLPNSRPVEFSPPPERVNRDLGEALQADPSRIKMSPSRGSFRPVVPSPRLGAEDLPSLARQVPDRVSGEDPTVMLSMQRLIDTSRPVPEILTSFFRFTVPNPFEYAEQLRGPLGTDQDAGLKPALVPPARP